MFIRVTQESKFCSDVLQASAARAGLLGGARTSFQIVGGKLGATGQLLYLLEGGDNGM